MPRKGAEWSARSTPCRSESAWLSKEAVYRARQDCHANGRGCMVRTGGLRRYTDCRRLLVTRICMPKGTVDSS